MIVELNPLTGLIEAWRWMVLSGYHPSFPSIADLARGDSGHRDMRLADLLPGSRQRWRTTSK